MKKSSTIFLQLVIALIGIGTLVFILWEPHLEGRNVYATPFEIYFHDPFLAYIYTAFIAFFVMLYQAFKLLAYIEKNGIFSQHSVKALRSIKRCAITFAAFIGGAEAYLLTVQRGKDDIAGGVVIGLVLIFGSIVTATVAMVFERFVLKRL